MANDPTQPGGNVQANGLPTRILRIEGERTAGMYANSIRVSRIDSRLRELSLSTASEQRKQFRLADQGYAKAVAQFEDALTQIEKDMANTNRSSNGSQRGNRTQGQTANPTSRQIPKPNQQSIPQTVERSPTGAVKQEPASQTPAPIKQQQQAPKKPQAQPQRPAIPGQAASQNGQAPKPVQQPVPQQSAKPVADKPAQQKGAQPQQQQGGGQKQPKQEKTKPVATATTALS